MKTLKLKPLTMENFAVYGRFHSMTGPTGAALGVGSPIRFYRDLVPLGTAQNLAASVTEVDPIPLVVDVMEYHTNNWEGFMGLDCDSYVVVAPATGDGTFKTEDLEAFFVPKGTFIYLHPGVWHYAPFPAENMVLHSLVLLPERTYANDCEKVFLAPEEQVALEV